MKRIEVWFSNGEFRAFPKVTELKWSEDGRFLFVKFGSGHKANINIANTNFVEMMDEPEEG
jgi:hypothetical protein